MQVYVAQKKYLKLKKQQAHLQQVMVTFISKHSKFVNLVQRNLELDSQRESKHVVILIEAKFTNYKCLQMNLTRF